MPNITFATVGSSPSASTTDVFECEIVEAINSISSAKVQVRRSDLPSDLETMNEISLSFGSEGVIWRGYLLDYYSEFDEYGAELVTIICEGRESELKWLSTYRGIELIGHTASASAARLLNGLSPSWTAQLNGTGYPSVTKHRFNNMSRYEAILELAKIFNAYVVFDRISRVVRFFRATSSSGITLTDADTIQPNNRVNRINRIEFDRSELYNRIIVESKTDGHELFDLRWSNRSSPYTIQQTFIQQPTVVDVASSVQWMLPEEVRFSFPLGLQVRGENRLVIAFLFTGLHQTWIPQVADLNIGDMKATRFMDSGGWQAFPPGGPLDLRCFAFYAVNPRSNNIRIDGALSPRASEEFYQGTGPVLITAFSIQDVDPRNPISGVHDSGAWTSFTASSNLSGSGTERLLVDALFRLANPDPTQPTVIPGSNQVNQFDGKWMDAWTGMMRINASYKLASGDNMQWSWAGNNRLRHFVVGVRPANPRFIEDSASVNKYERRVGHFNLGDFRGDMPYMSVGTAANAMYDHAVHLLVNHKDPKEAFDVEALITSGPLSWNVGNTIVINTAQMNRTLVVMERRQIFNEAGEREWNIKCATHNRFKESYANIMQEILNQIRKIYAQQV